MIKDLICHLKEIDEFEQFKKTLIQIKNINE